MVRLERGGVLDSRFNARDKGRVGVDRNRRDEKVARVRLGLDQLSRGTFWGRGSRGTDEHGARSLDCCWCDVVGQAQRDYSDFNEALRNDMVLKWLVARK